MLFQGNGISISTIIPFVLPRHHLLKIFLVVGILHLLYSVYAALPINHILHPVAFILRPHLNSIQFNFLSAVCFACSGRDRQRLGALHHSIPFHPPHHITTDFSLDPQLAHVFIWLGGYFGPGLAWDALWTTDTRNMTG
jgi:hypothetical protein